LGPPNCCGQDLITDKFQFLSRNSVRWDGMSSEPRSCHSKRFNSSVGILSVGTGLRSEWLHSIFFVSIPQSEFCPLGHGQMILAQLKFTGFNSSVGILSVGTLEVGGTLEVLESVVSIPQSEFCPLGQRLYWTNIPNVTRFNSSVGILSVGTLTTV